MVAPRFEPNLTALDVGKKITTCRAILLIMVGIIVVYANSLHGEWHYDDLINIVDNPTVHISSLDLDTL